MGTASDAALQRRTVGRGVRWVTHGPLTARHVADSRARTEQAFREGGVARKFSSVGVIGLGTMGAGIVEVFARKGVDVVAVEVDEAALERARASITGSTDRAVAREKLSEAERDALLGRIRFVVGLAELSGVDLDVEALCESLGKVDVTINDRAGFIANALLFGYLNHAVALYEANYVSREDLDAAMRLGCGLPMGPLALMDLIGLDTAYEILDTMYRRGGRDRRHAPVPLIKQMVTAGLLGRKSGRGFYTYEKPGSPKAIPDAATPAPVSAGDGATVRTVGVVGSGTMASGIVEVFARAGYDVIAVARAADKAAKLRDKMTASLTKGVVRGKLSEADRDAALGRVTWSAELERLADVDLVVEAVVEELIVKKALFASLDEICKPGVVLATTTSSLPVIECAMATGRPADVVGLHFFNPAPVMGLVEVVRTIRTSPEVVATATGVCQAIGKQAVVCADRAGFVVNALLFPYLNDAVKMLEASYASADDIDYAMKLGCAYPMGPFQLLDVVGLDVSLAIQQTLYLELREPGFAPAPLLEQLVTAGYLGRKVGRGFRDYR